MLGHFPYIINIEDNHFVINPTLYNKDINLRLFIKIKDNSYNYLSDYIKKYGEISITIGDSLDYIYIKTKNKNYSFENTMFEEHLFEGNLLADINNDGYQLSKQCFDLYTNFIY